MIRIEYCKHGVAARDFDVEEYEEAFLMATSKENLVNKVIELWFSTENVFELVLTLIAEDKIPADQVVFIYNGQELHPNQYGRLEDWPKGFCSTVGDLVERRLRAQMNKYKENNSEHGNELHSKL
jgi:hypothetical protein